MKTGLSNNSQCNGETVLAQPPSQDKDQMKTGLNINSKQTAGVPRLFLTMFVEITDSHNKSTDSAKNGPLTAYSHC